MIQIMSVFDNIFIWQYIYSQVQNSHQDIIKSIFFNIRSWIYHFQIWTRLFIRMLNISQKTCGILLPLFLLMENVGNNNARIRESLELECSREKDINTYLSYIDMMKSSYQLYMKALIILFHNSLLLNLFDFDF